MMTKWSLKVQFEHLCTPRDHFNFWVIWYHLDCFSISKVHSSYLCSLISHCPAFLMYQVWWCEWDISYISLGHLNSWSLASGYLGGLGFALLENMSLGLEVKDMHHFRSLCFLLADGDVWALGHCSNCLSLAVIPWCILNPNPLKS